MSGIEIIRAVQSFQSPLLDKIGIFLTDLHSENIYLFVLPVLLWLYDKRFAKYMISVFMLGYWANDLLKDLFHTARPSPNDVRVIRPEPSYAFPSGHSQNPLMFWGALAVKFHRTWLTVILAIMVFLIGFSRLYVGVHWPLDIVGGWAIGALMLWGFVATYDFWVGERMTLGQRLLWAVAVPTGCLALSFALGAAPALSATGGAAGHFWVITGAYYGLWIGCILEEEFIGFDPRRGGLGVQLAKVVIGLVLILAVKEGFKLFLPDTGLGDAIRYFCVALMGTLGAPWVFGRFTAAPPAGRSIAR
ncbi:MAG TPA: phosphatase PAP2 family protein [Symbiobacteriaceae bacterium]|nr:phosphatase PAP2 family protein [Symbiobacteriaceae bacterium]